MFTKIRLYITITGVVILYTFVHEFAYRQYKTPDTWCSPEKNQSNSKYRENTDTVMDTTAALISE